MTHVAARIAFPAALQICLGFAPAIANSQAPDQRAAIANLRDSLGASADIAAIEALKKRVSSKGRQNEANALRLGTIDHRLGELTGDRKYFDAAVARFAEATRRHRDWAEAWYGIGLAKLELYAGGFPAKEGPYQRSGSDYLHGAAEAFSKALEADPDFGAAAERLASSVLRQNVQPQVLLALAPLRRAVSGPGAVNPALQMSRGLLERETGHSDSALATFQRVLELGGDSGVAYLERARTLFDLRRPDEARTAYYSGANLASSRAAVAHYRSDIAWIATPQELAAYDAIGTPAGRANWLGDFWHRRDLQDGRGADERLAEHYRRFFYVMRNFRLISEQQQRATIRSVQSPLLESRTPSIEDRLRQMVRKLASGERQLAGQLAGGAVRSAVEEGSTGELPTDPLSEAYAQLNDQTLLRAYRSDQHVVDDRGVIYIRHGEPSKRATYSGPDADPNESWLYAMPSGQMLFHFTGVTAPTTLIEQLPLNPALLATRAGLDPRYEEIAADAERYRLQPAKITEDRARGRQAIVQGTKTDSYRLTFERPIEPVVQVFGASEGLDGAGRLLVVFAIKGADLTYRRMGPDSVIAYPIALRIIARNAVSGVEHRIDTTRVFATRRILRKDEFLTGQAQMAAPPGRYDARVIVASEGWDAGAATSRSNLEVPDLGTSRLTMSDPILGRDQSSQQWISPPDTVQLNPLNAYPVGSRVEVYYQVGGLKSGSSYETRIEVRRQGKSDRVGAEFREENLGPKVAHFRSVALGKLPPGEYVLTVTMKEVDGSASVTRRQSLNVTEE